MQLRHLYLIYLGTEDSQLKYIHIYLTNFPIYSLIVFFFSKDNNSISRPHKSEFEELNLHFLILFDILHRLCLLHQLKHRIYSLSKVSTPNPMLSFLEDPCRLLNFFLVIPLKAEDKFTTVVVFPTPFD